MRYNINCLWDNDACVWVATSDDVKGLVLESNSFDALIEKVKVAIPELIDLNKNSSNYSISYNMNRLDEVLI